MHTALKYNVGTGDLQPGQNLDGDSDVRLHPHLVRQAVRADHQPPEVDLLG